MAESNVRKPRVLILGGCGFIGRNLVSHLVENESVGFIRVADKVPPPMAWLNEKHREAFASPLVEYVSSNLVNSASREHAFASEEEWDYVINLAAETKPNQEDVIYKQGTIPLSVGCAELSAKLKVKRYIELSDGHLKTSKKPLKEEDEAEAYTVFAKCKLQVEKELSSIQGLDYVIIRPAIVYGLGDRYGLTPWLILGAIYRHLGEPLRLLWHSDIHFDTVHVVDVCRAIWHVCTSSQVSSGQVYHLSDGGETTLGDLAQLTATLFEIKYNFVGKTLSMFAKVDMDGVVEDANDKHLPPWAELCRIRGVDNTPLCPYATSDNLCGRHLWLDATKLNHKAHFEISIPKPTTALLKQVIDDFVSMGLFPSMH